MTVIKSFLHSPPKPEWQRLLNARMAPPDRGPHARPKRGAPAKPPAAKPSLGPGGIHRVYTPGPVSADVLYQGINLVPRVATPSPAPAAARRTPPPAPEVTPALPLWPATLLGG
jgi:hypothetical protein